MFSSITDVQETFKTDHAKPIRSATDLDSQFFWQNSNFFQWILKDIAGCIYDLIFRIKHVPGLDIFRKLIVFRDTNPLQLEF